MPKTIQKLKTGKFSLSTLVSKLICNNCQDTYTCSVCKLHQFFRISDMITDGNITLQDAYKETELNAEAALLENQVKYDNHYYEPKSNVRGHVLKPVRRGFYD